MKTARQVSERVENQASRIHEELSELSVIPSIHSAAMFRIIESNVRKIRREVLIEAAEIAASAFGEANGGRKMP